MLDSIYCDDVGVKLDFVFSISVVIFFGQSKLFACLYLKKFILLKKFTKPRIHHSLLCLVCLHEKLSELFLALCERHRAHFFSNTIHFIFLLSYKFVSPSLTALKLNIFSFFNSNFFGRIFLPMILLLLSLLGLKLLFT